MFGTPIRSKPLYPRSVANISRFILICTIVENNEVKTVRKKDTSRNHLCRKCLGIVRATEKCAECMVDEVQKQMESLQAKRVEADRESISERQASLPDYVKQTLA